MALCCYWYVFVSVGCLLRACLLVFIYAFFSCQAGEKTRRAKKHVVVVVVVEVTLMRSPTNPADTTENTEGKKLLVLPDFRC